MNYTLKHEQGLHQDETHVISPAGAIVRWFTGCDRDYLARAWILSN